MPTIRYKSNVREWNASHARFVERLEREASEQIERDAQRVMDVSKTRYVPVKEGVLRASGSVSRVQRLGKRLRIVLTYGLSGPAKDYAVPQHERTDFQHPRGGQAFYLEEPFRDNIKIIGEHLQGALRRALRAFGR